MNFNVDFLISEKGKKLSDIKNDLKNIDSQTDKTASNFENKMNSSAKSVNQVGLAFSQLQTKLIGAFAGFKAFDFIKDAISNGLNYNKVLENSVNSITSLIVATSAQESSTGRLLSLEERYNLARIEALDVMKQIEAINKQTPSTLAETLNVYKAMLPTFRALNTSQADLIELTKLFSIAGINNGLTIDQLTSGLDGLTSGTVDAGSELGKFLKALELNNEALKEMVKNGNLVGGLKDKLAAFNKSFNSMDEITSNFENSWNNLTKTLTNGIFISLKDQITNLTSFINDSAIPAVDTFFKSFRSLDDIKKDVKNFKSIFDIQKEVNSAEEELKRLKDGAETFGSLINNTEAIKSKEDEIKLLKEQQKIILENSKINKNNKETLVAKVEEKPIKTTEDIAKDREILSNYYKIIGQTRKSFEIDLEDEIKKIKESGALNEEQINNYKLSKIKEFEKQQSDLLSKNKNDNKEYYTKDLIEFYNASNKEKEAFLLNLEEELKLLKERGNLNSEQIQTIKTKKITEYDTNAEAEAKKIQDKINSDKESQRQQDVYNSQNKLRNEIEYYTTIKDFDTARAKDLELYHAQNIEMGYTKEQMLNMENEKAKELTETYKNLYLQELQSQQTVIAGFELYMNDLDTRINDYKSLSLEVFNSIENGLNNSFSSFFDKTGDSFLSLKDLAKNALSDILGSIQSVITKMITMQVLQSTLGGFGGSTGGLTSLFSGFFKDGGVFDNGRQLRKFATGGVVSTPTFFGTNSGPGVMGEAGPEGILPLKKVNGKLGVSTDGAINSSNVNININNYSGSQVTQTQDENGNVNIDIIDKQLASKLSNGSSETGKVLMNKYDLNKR